MSTNTREALAAVREALQLANDMERNSPICDTIWMPGGRETLFDFIDAALATQPAQPVAKMAPVQGWPAGIPWSLHLEAYAEYCKRHGAQPALIDLEGRNCRGGFGVRELDSLIPGWRDRCGEIADLKAEVARLNALLAAAPRPAQPSAPIDAFELYAELRDLVAEAGAVDTLIGRPEVLRSRLADLCKRVGQLTTDLPLGTAQPSATCEWTNCPRRVGDVCCNEKAAQPSAPPAAYTVSGKPLVWSHTYDDQWLDEDYGFSIMLERDSETPYYAAWGEGDSEDFATLEEAKAWCQAEIDRWVRRSVVVTPAQPSALGAAHAVPNELTTKQIEEIAFAVLRSHNDDRLWRALTYDSGPYDVTKATLALQDLAAAFFRAGLASAPAAPAQAVPQQDICCEGDCHYYGQKRPSTCCCSKGG